MKRLQWIACAAMMALATVACGDTEVEGPDGTDAGTTSSGGESSSSSGETSSSSGGSGGTSSSSGGTSSSSGVTSSSSGDVERCGDGIVQEGEACDDANVIDGDGCDSNCAVTACGNGIVTDGEACDDANVIDGDGCDSNCAVTACGNGIVTDGEACDDGNLVDGDGCDRDCSVTACGNGIVTDGEVCDDGNLVDGDGCDSNCSVTACGNGIVSPGEECDDGNTIDGDGCESDCTRFVPEVLYYRFDGAGPEVPNLASSPPLGAETAVLMGGLSQGAGGLCGGAMIGTGNSASTDRLNTNWATSLSSQASFTISFWTADVTESSTLFYIFGDSSANSFRCFTNGVAGPGNWILRGGGLTDVYLNGGATVAPHMSTFVYDATRSEVRAYLDGALVNTVAQANPFSFQGDSFSVYGYATNVGMANGGKMDEFRLFNRALTDTQVANMFTSSAVCQ